VIYLNERAKQTNAFVIPGEKPPQIYISAKDGNEEKRFNQYREFISENVPEIKEEVSKLTLDDWFRKTILHEDSHLEIFEKFGGFKDANEIVEQDSNFKPYLDILFEMDSKHISSPVMTNEVMAEDLRIIRAKKNKDPTQHIYSKDTHSIDIDRPGLYQQRLKILEKAFYGGKE
jgi:hypothetical protein